jgi:indole-3-glycerol phosphate synthase
VEDDTNDDANGDAHDNAEDYMSILDTIAAATRLRVKRLKESRPLEDIRDAALSRQASADFPFEAALRGDSPEGRIAFICEVKKASPSKGVIREDFCYRDIARDYEQAGASAVSVLTEPDFFWGSSLYLSEISATISLPLLRKDFIVDTYQIYESSLLGASAVLFICALLNDTQLTRFVTLAHELGLSALIEAHTADETRRALAVGGRIVGINNRDLDSFEVDLRTSIRLRNLVPPEVLFISESGISTRKDIAALIEANVDAVLIGESVMRADDRVAFLAELRGDRSD